MVGIFITWPTNYEGLVGRARLQEGTQIFQWGCFSNSHILLFDSGEWVLVTAAAGGIGMSAVQIAKGMCIIPCTLIGLCRWEDTDRWIQLVDQLWVRK